MLVDVIVHWHSWPSFAQKMSPLKKLLTTVFLSSSLLVNFPQQGRSLALLMPSCGKHFVTDPIHLPANSHAVEVEHFDLTPTHAYQPISHAYLKCELLQPKRCKLKPMRETKPPCKMSNWWYYLRKLPKHSICDRKCVGERTPEFHRGTPKVLVNPRMWSCIFGNISHLRIKFSRFWLGKRW